MRILLFIGFLALVIQAAPPEQQEKTEAEQTERQNPAADVFQNMLQFPQNVFNSITGQRSRAAIGETCQYTTDCLDVTKNSVCFNGTCLCNLGYRYTQATADCKPVDPCPVCDVDKCDKGDDVFCDGTCVDSMKRFNADSSYQMITSPNWPEEYPADMDAFYCLKAPAGRRVNLKLLWLDLETHCGHSCDSITIYNGCVARPENILAYYNGDNTNDSECVTSYCNEIMIRFKTDADEGLRGDQRSGFMGYFSESLYEDDMCAFRGVRKPEP